MSEEVVINLVDFKTSPESRVFSGRPRGEYCRSLMRLDNLDREERHVRIIIPPETYAINMSFFLGLFGPSIRRRGKRDFYLRYHFDGSEHIVRVIPQYVNEAMSDAVGLPEVKTA